MKYHTDVFQKIYLSIKSLRVNNQKNSVTPLRHNGESKRNFYVGTYYQFQVLWFSLSDNNIKVTRGYVNIFHQFFHEVFHEFV